MGTVVLERDGKGPIEFDGWVISQVSTEQDGKQRWTELTLYAVDKSDVMWVVEVVGESTVRNEQALKSVHVCRSGEDLIRVLSRKGSVTAPGRQLLEKASEVDAETAEVYKTYTSQVERL